VAFFFFGCGMLAELFLAHHKLAITRYGFLTNAVWYFTGELLRNPITLDFTAWYASHGLIAVGAVAGLAIFGLYISQGGRPLFRDVLTERST
jgi:hypothetical protein